MQDVVAEFSSGNIVCKGIPISCLLDLGSEVMP